MPRRYTYVVTCIKETPIRWGMEFESVNGSIPSKVVQFPLLAQPLTSSPYFHSGSDPIPYFRQLLKGLPEMLRGYNTRTLKQIQRRMDQLQVGASCYVKVSYIDNGEAVSPYNYNLEILEETPSDPLESLSTPPQREQPYLPFAVPSVDSFPAPPTADRNRAGRAGGRDRVDSTVYRETEAAVLIEQLQEEVRKLQADMEFVKECLTEMVNPSERQPSMSNPDPMPVEAKGSRQSNGILADPVELMENRQQDITLNPDEQDVIQYIMSQKTVTESQLRNVCYLTDPIETMSRLIEKMSHANFPWIASSESESGELIYTWNPPEEGVE